MCTIAFQTLQRRAAVSAKTSPIRASCHSLANSLPEDQRWKTLNTSLICGADEDIGGVRTLSRVSSPLRVGGHGSQPGCWRWERTLEALQTAHPEGHSGQPGSAFGGSPLGVLRGEIMALKVLDNQQDAVGQTAMSTAAPAQGGCPAWG